MPAILTENLFIDNSTDAARLKDGSFLQRVARGHAAGLAAAFNLKKKTTTIPPPQPSLSPLHRAACRTFYKVQTGAFSKRANAEKLGSSTKRRRILPFYL